MAKKEKLVYPNPKFFKAKDNMDWKKQGANLAEVGPVGLLKHLAEDADDFHQVFALFFPVNVIFRFPKARIRVLNFGHYALPPSL